MEDRPGLDDPVHRLRPRHPIPGFAIAPTGMKVGGRRQVTIPAEFGYGEQGSPPAIPGGAALVFVIDLVKVTPPAG